MDVLIVDDEPISRLAVAQTLQSAGYGVTVACSGEEALARLTHQNMQLVVCDWSMPGMNGLELCRTIRSNTLRRYIYILMLTSHNRPQDTLEGLEAGADDYVTKPFNPAELVLRVNTGRRIIRSESSDMTIFALAKLAESRDSDTGTHLERVRSYCRLLAQELQFHPAFRDVINDDYVHLIYETSPLHDIGKVAIPDSILLKPGKLTADEFEVMKTHTVHGAQTLAAAMNEFPNAEFLRMAHDIALCHHERYDGRGYPGRLAGEAIPLCGRIVALADVYDALTSKRVYKSAMSHEEARTIIVSERGEHFDPNVVDAFLQRENEFLRIQLAAHVTHAENEMDRLPHKSSACFPASAFAECRPGPSEESMYCNLPINT
ncbi:MAG: response regulator [Pirellulaceae bacterium]|nr:response regulator [Pirellulaceae bacterium]